MQYAPIQMDKHSLSRYIWNIRINVPSKNKNKNENQLILIMLWIIPAFLRLNAEFKCNGYKINKTNHQTIIIAIQQAPLKSISYRFHAEQCVDGKYRAFNFHEIGQTETVNAFAVFSHQPETLPCCESRWVWELEGSELYWQSLHTKIQFNKITISNSLPIPVKC